MAQITEDFARLMIAKARLREHTPLTVGEQSQLAYAWLLLNMLRTMVANGEDGDQVLAYLADPEEASNAVQSREVSGG